MMVTVLAPGLIGSLGTVTAFGNHHFSMMLFMNGSRAYMGSCLIEVAV